MSISNNIVALLSGESIVRPIKIIGDRSMPWLDLMEKLEIRPTEKEKSKWQQDVNDVKSNIPSRIEMILSSSLTPSGRRFRSLFASLERKKLSHSILLEQIPFVPYIPSNSGAQYRAESYVTYLRILHDYMKYVDIFQNLQQEMNPLYGWRKQAILTGCLLYRKLVQMGKIKAGEKLSLDENFTRIDFLALTGRHGNGREMSLDEQVAYINNIAQQYGEPQKEQTEALLETPPTKKISPKLKKQNWLYLLRQKIQRWHKVKAKSKKYTPWYIRKPNLAIIVGIFHGLKHTGNFFLHLKENFTPLKQLFQWFRKEKSPAKGISETPAISKTSALYDEELREMFKTNYKLAQLVAEKQQKMDEIRAKRKWTAREIFKTFIGISDLDKLDKEYNKKFDELARKQEAEANAGHESWGQKFITKARQVQSKAFSFVKNIFSKPAPETKQEGKSAITASIVPVAENSVVQQPAETPAPQPVIQKTSVLDTERTHKIEAILENKAKVLSEDRTITYAPDLSKLGDPDRVIAVLDSLIDDLRVKTLLTDHDMGSITLMSHIINAYGSGNKNLSYLNNLHVCDRFQLEVAHLVAIKLRANGINVPCKAYRIKNSSDSRAQIKQWRIALEQKNRANSAREHQQSNTQTSIPFSALDKRERQAS